MTTTNYPTFLAFLFLFLPGSFVLSADSIYRGGPAGGDDSERISEAALPAELLTFEARDRSALVEVRWETAHEVDLAGFTVEFAPDGEAFRPVAFRTPSGGAGGITSYAVELSRPRSPEAYYRLRIEEVDGNPWYSSIAHLSFLATDWAVAPLQNPVPSDRISLKSRGLSPGEPLSVSLTDMTGRTLHAREYTAEEIVRLEIAGRLTPGPYVLTVVRAQGRPQSHKLIVR